MLPPNDQIKPFVPQRRKIPRKLIIIILILSVLCTVGGIVGVYYILQREREPTFMYQPSGELLRSSEYQNMMQEAQNAMRQLDKNKLQRVYEEAAQTFAPPQGQKNIDFLYMQYQLGALDYQETSMQPAIDAVYAMKQIVEGVRDPIVRSFFMIDKEGVQAMENNVTRPAGIAGGES